MHRHDGDLWLPPAPSSYRKRVYGEESQLPPSRSQKERRKRVHGWREGGKGVRREKVDSAACPPKSRFFFFFLVNDGRAATMTDRGCLTSFRKKKEKERKAQIDPDYSHKVSRYYKTTSEGDDAHTNASPSSRRELHI